MSKDADDLDKFYELIGEHRKHLGGGRVLSGASGRDGWPDRGIYLFFEPGEVRSDA